jgi:3-hydroxyisobutyrate dehydrogenase
MADGAARPALGFIGLGLMGQPMVLRLLAAGYDVTVWNREPERLEPALAAGAKAAADPKAVAEAAEVVLLCVLDTDAVEEVVFGEAGVVRAAEAPRLLIDHSTAFADRTKAMAERLKAETGADWIDAPLSGGPPAAEAGQLTAMLGGSEAAVEAAQPILAAYAARATRMGEAGAGQATKMVNQVIGYADGNLLQKVYPRLQRREFTPPAGFARQMLKDLDMVHDLAKATKTPTPLSAVTATLYRQLIGRGYGHLDTCAVLGIYDETIEG